MSNDALRSRPTSSKIRGVRIFETPRHIDPRGLLIKPVAHPLVHGEIGVRKEFGEIYLVTARRATVRGSHYHKTTTELFCVISGRGRLRLSYGGVTEEHLMSAETPVTILVPPLVHHSIIGDSDGEMIMLAYADRPYLPDDTDTFTGEVTS